MRRLSWVAVIMMILVQRAAGQEAVNLPAQPDKGTTLHGAEQVKTMERQQVMANYLQAVASNVTSTDKKVTLKATLFALDGKDSVEKNKSTYYLNHHWQRNTQLLIGSGLDKNSTINGFSAGLSFNVLNKRDASEVNFWSALDQQTRDSIQKVLTAELQHYHDSKQADISTGIIRIARQHFDRNEETGVLEDIIAFIGLQNLPPDVKSDVNFRKFADLLLADISGNLKYRVFDVDKQAAVKNSHLDLFGSFVTTVYFEAPLAKEMKAYLYSVEKNGKAPSDNSPTLELYAKAVNKVIAAKASSLHGKDLVEVYTYLRTDYKRVSDRIAKAPILTFSYNYAYVTSGVKFSHVPAVQYLKGLWSNSHGIRSWELNITGADTICTDTSKANKPVNRHIGALQIGLNRVLFTDKAAASLLEAKLAFESDFIIAGKQTKEDGFKPIGSLTIQGRPSAKSPWFKLVAKYDKSGKFFGFLNITLNLDNSANKSS